MIPAAAALAASLSWSAAARRLLAADADVPRREAAFSNLPLAIDERGGAAPEIVFDPLRLRDLPPGEAEAEYAYALARAAVAAPLPFVEAEEAARLKTALVLVEAAEKDGALSQELIVAGPAPERRGVVLARAAAFLDRFAGGPEAAYAGVERDLPRDAVRLSEIEDLLSVRAAEIRALSPAPAEAFVALGGRRYPGPLVRAAWLLRAPGAVEKARESLDAYDTVGAAALENALERRRAALSKPRKR